MRSGKVRALAAVLALAVLTTVGCSYRQLDDGSVVQEFDAQKFAMAIEALDLALDKYFEIRERLDAENEEEAIEEAREEDREFDRLIAGAERILGNETVQEIIQNRIERKRMELKSEESSHGKAD